MVSKIPGERHWINFNHAVWQFIEEQCRLTTEREGASCAPSRIINGIIDRARTAAEQPDAKTERQLKAIAGNRR